MPELHHTIRRLVNFSQLSRSGAYKPYVPLKCMSYSRSLWYKHIIAECQ